MKHVNLSARIHKLSEEGQEMILPFLTPFQFMNSGKTTDIHDAFNAFFSGVEYMKDNASKEDYQIMYELGQHMIVETIDKKVFDTVFCNLFPPKEYEEELLKHVPNFFESTTGQQMIPHLLGMVEDLFANQDFAYCKEGQRMDFVPVVGINEENDIHLGWWPGALVSPNMVGMLASALKMLAEKRNLKLVGFSSETIVTDPMRDNETVDQIEKAIEKDPSLFQFFATGYVLSTFTHYKDDPSKDELFCVKLKKDNEGIELVDNDVQHILLKDQHQNNNPWVLGPEQTLQGVTQDLADPFFRGLFTNDPTKNTRH